MTTETSPRVLALMSAIAHEKPLLSAVMKAERAGEHPSRDALNRAQLRKCGEFAEADLLIGCRGGRAVALPVRKTGGELTPGAVLTLVAFSDREAGEAYIARRRLGADGMELVLLSELMSAKASGLTWAKLYDQCSAERVLVNPYGPYMVEMPRAGLALSRAASKPWISFRRPEVPPFMDADSRREFRTRWSTEFGKLDSFVQSGRFDEADELAPSLAFQIEFSWTCGDIELMQRSTVIEFAEGKDEMATRHLLFSAQAAADFGFPEDSVDWYLTVGGRLRELLAAGSDTEEWVVPRAWKVVEALEHLLSSWVAACVEPHRTDEARTMIADLRREAGLDPVGDD